MPLLNQAEFAKKINRMPSYVTKLKKEGRLVMRDGLVDVDESIKRIEETADPAKKGVVERNARIRNGDKADEPEKTADEDMGMDKNYQSAKALKAHYDALKAKIEYEQTIGQLLPAPVVVSAAAKAASVIDSRLANLAEVLTPQLATETDANAIKNLLEITLDAVRAELHRAFKDLANPKPKTN